MAERTRADRILRWRGGWARVRPWRGRADTAYLALSSDRVDRQVPTRCSEELRDRGYTAVVTSALAPSEALPFLDAGFVVRERLDLMRHRMDSIPAPTRPTRRMRRADLPSILLVDRLAFVDDWRLDADGFDDAVGATPTTRVRVARDADALLGYAVTGRAGHRGYIQRVAIHPSAQRRGWGRSLVADALDWLARHGVTNTVVNTQVDNVAAHELYLACGFEPLPVGLCVLGREL